MKCLMLKDCLKPQSAMRNAFTRFITSRFILCTLGASPLYNRQMLGRFRQGSVLYSPDLGKWLEQGYVAQYALESSSQPLGISEYELEKLYPEKVEGTMPSIKEIEDKLDDQTNS